MWMNQRNNSENDNLRQTEYRIQIFLSGKCLMFTIFVKPINILWSLIWMLFWRVHHRKGVTTKLVYVMRFQGGIFSASTLPLFCNDIFKHNAFSWAQIMFFNSNFTSYRGGRFFFLVAILNIHICITNPCNVCYCVSDTSVMCNSWGN